MDNFGESNILERDNFLLETFGSKSEERSMNLNNHTSFLSASPTVEEVPLGVSEWEILQRTLEIFGSISLSLVLLYCFLRKRLPYLFNIRAWSPGIYTELANDHFGWIDWIWKVYRFSDDEVRIECGMDALCYLRALKFGFRICLVGMFNSVWLIPVYATEEKFVAKDFLSLVTINNLPNGSRRLIFSVLAAYIFFGSTIFLLFREFRWFTSNRHKFLSEFSPRNYTIFVRHIPKELRDNKRLKNFFASVFGANNILEAQVDLNVPGLEKRHDSRRKVFEKLEHAIAIKNMTGFEAMYKINGINNGVRGETHNVIEAFTQELDEMNFSVAKGQRIIRERIREKQSRNKKNKKERHSHRASISFGDDSTDSLTSSNFSRDNNMLSSPTSFEDGGRPYSTTGQFPLSGNDVDHFRFRYDGKAKDAGFVTFTHISSCQAARQLNQHHTPHVMDIYEAPHPKEIFWQNIGLSHKRITVGRLGSVFFTAILLVLWTIPTVIIVSFGDIAQLREVIPPLIGDWIEDRKELQPWLVLLGPLLLVCLNIGILPKILKAISKNEGHFSKSTLESSTFYKVSFFIIVQTFFVSTVAGSVIAGYKDISITDNPYKILQILASTMPYQTTYFLQIILVSTFIRVPFELFRFLPLLQAFLAANTWFHLTWKEKMRTKPLLFNSLSDPSYFPYARIFSNDILNFVVLFTFGNIAPIVPWVLAACQLLLRTAYRHNFIFNYNSVPDSGGHMWLNFISLVQTSLLIGEITIFAYLIIKQVLIASFFMIPLIIATLLMNHYLRQKHFWVADFLPLDRCVEVDSGKKGDFSLFKGQYKRPCLGADDLEPDWDHGKEDRAWIEKRSKMSFMEKYIFPLFRLTPKVDFNETIHVLGIDLVEKSNNENTVSPPASTSRSSPDSISVSDSIKSQGSRDSDGSHGSSVASKHSQYSA